MQQFIDNLISRLEEKAEIEREECKKLAESKLIEFVAKYNHGEYCYVNAINIVNQLAEEYKPRANADRIRSMTEEELADFIVEFRACDVCPYFEERCTLENPCTKELAGAMIYTWLHSEAKE